MERTEVIAGVAGDLHATEAAVDAAISSAMTLVQSMIGARAALSLSPTVGTEAQAKAVEAIAALSSAREAIVASHGAMAKDHRRLGYGVYAVGPMDKYPEGDRPPSVSADERRLRAV